jgi:2-C-methyl-D-erythritol 2,4-cyclodiphosphate synthase
MRIGQSTDIHQLVEGRDLILGGVKIEHSKGLLGHSDADVLIHAIMEALIGAMGLGDLGKHFPDTDPKYKGISSLLLLEETYHLMEENGYVVSNIDATILAERPKMAPHIIKMRENIARALHTDVTNINIKATRGEKLGFVGREEGMMAQAVCLIETKRASVEFL